MERESPSCKTVRTMVAGAGILPYALLERFNRQAPVKLGAAIAFRARKLRIRTARLTLMCSPGPSIAGWGYDFRQAKHLGGHADSNKSFIGVDPRSSAPFFHGFSREPRDVRTHPDPDIQML